MPTPPATEPTARADAEPRPLRADAQRNRERILAAARAAVTERGSDIVLEDVARQAGVGIGTLYRHFPTRQDLFEAAFLHEAVELTRRAQALAGEVAPFDALITWLRQQIDFGSHGHSMGAAVMAAKHVDGSELQVACNAMRDAGSVLLRRAQDAGEARPEIQMADVLRLTHGIVLANQAAPDPERLERMFDLVVAGLRA
jgi:AcrR family transcriptional regulator